MNVPSSGEAFDSSAMLMRLCHQVHGAAVVDDIARGDQPGGRVLGRLRIAAPGNTSTHSEAGIRIPELTARRQA